MTRFLFCLVLCGARTITAAEESAKYPLDATLVNDSQVRCGPGLKHYVTQTLKAGTHVEVYRRDPGGWLAIRPPEESFSWVRADQLAVAGESLGRVVGGEVVAWVGTSSGEISEHKWQVRLKPDELVEVSGRREFRVLPQYPVEEYCRIAPPSGEYRWIRARDIAPLDTSTPPAAASDVRLTDFRIVVDQADTAEVAAELDQPEPRRDTFVARKKRRADPSPDRAEEPRLASRSSPVPSIRPNGDPDFERRARELDLRLALTVSRSPGAWSLADLRPRLDELSEQAGTTLQRARAKVLLDRLDKYESLQARYVGLDEESDGPSVSSVSLAPAVGETATTSDVDPRFDGHGWLLPVHSSKRESPPYALLDEKGTILHFVSPAPGLNLHRYLRKEIGIIGQRSRSGLLDKPHLTAHRVVNLQRHR